MFGNRGGGRIGGKLVAFGVAAAALVAAGGMLVGEVFAGPALNKQQEQIETCLPLRDAAQLQNCLDRGER